MEMGSYSKVSSQVVLVKPRKFKKKPGVVQSTEDRTS